MLTESDIHEEQSLIDQLQAQWMIGSDQPLNLGTLPSSWKRLLEQLPSDRIPIIALALTGQHQSVLFQSQVPDNLLPHPLLPELNQAVIPSALRPHFRRVLESLDKLSGIEHAVFLRFLFHRGYVAHPADWLPSSKDERLPEIYLPWCHWVNNEVNIRNENERLTKENWDEWYPSTRLIKLKQLRFENASAARTLIERCAMSEPADKRLKIIETLSTNLTIEDQDFLLTLLDDRSQKITLLASQYLARLGYRNHNIEGNKEDNSAQELADGFKLKKSGFLNRHLQILPLKLNNTKQLFRSELLGNVPLGEFSNALCIELPELVSNWQFEKNYKHDNQLFIINATNTLPDDQIQSLINNLLAYLQSNNDEFNLLSTLLPRIKEDERRALIIELLHNPSFGISFYHCHFYLPEPVVDLTWTKLKATAAWKNLHKLLAIELNENSYIKDLIISRELIALGLILPVDTANQVITAIIEMGGLRADPTIDCLKFNVEIKSGKDFS